MRAILHILPKPMSEKVSETMSNGIWPSTITNEQLEDSPGWQGFLEGAGRVREARGEARGEANAIVLVLQARAIALSEEQRARIASCVDKSVIERWLVRAVTAATAEDVFRDE